jgi:hypothetical protein
MAKEKEITKINENSNRFIALVSSQNLWLDSTYRGNSVLKPLGLVAEAEESKADTYFYTSGLGSYPIIGGKPGSYYPLTKKLVSIWYPLLI